MMRKTFLFAAVLTLSLSLFGIDYRHGLNVMDFGAKGDGIADDTVAIQKALNAATSKIQRELLARTPTLEGAPQLGNLPVNGSCSEILEVPEVYFPGGIYKISRMLYTPYYLCLRGEGNATIKMTDAASDLLYAHTFRLWIKGLTFNGGRRQIVHYTHNEDTANVTIEDCRFLNAKVTAFHSKNFLRPGKESYWRRITGFYDIDKTNPDEPVYTPLDETLPATNNSTIISFQNCCFDNCGVAMDFSSDGVVLKNCRIRNCDDGAALRVGGHVEITGLDVELPARHNAQSYIEHDNYGLAIHDSKFTTLGQEVPLLRLVRKKFGEIPPYLIVRNTAAACGASLLHSCNATGENLPYWIDVSGVKNTGKSTAQLLSFDRPSNAAALKNAIFDYSPAVHAIPGSKLGSPHPRQIYCHDNQGISTDKLPVHLKAVLQPPLPDKVLKEAYFTLSELSDTDMEQIFRERIRAVDYGVDTDPATDDTAALQKAADAAGKSGAILELPPVKLLLSDTVILPQNAALDSPGIASVRQTNLQKPAFKIPNARNLWARNMRIIGGTHAFDIESTADIPAKALIEKILFYSQHSYSVKMRAGKENRSRLQVDRCSFIYPFNGVSSDAAETGIATCWYSTNSRQHMSPVIENLGGRMISEAFLGVPVTSLDHKPNFLPVIPNWPYAREMRWFDNHGQLLLIGGRFGGEYRGIPIVYNFTSKGTLAIDGGFSCFFSESHKLCMIYNFANPKTTLLRNIGWGYVHGPTGATVKYAPGNTEKATVHTRNFYYETDSFINK